MTQYDFFSDYISDYAVGAWGWIYGSAFLASAIGCFALAAALVLLTPSLALSGIGVVLLLLVSVTFVVDSPFRPISFPPERRQQPERASSICWTRSWVGGFSLSGAY